MASAGVVGGVLLALIEGMGIMFTKMTAQPVPTEDDYKQAALQQDVTAPPTAGPVGRMLPAMLGGGGGGSTASIDQAEPPPPTVHDQPFGTETTFQSEGVDASSNGSSSSSSSWWPSLGGNS